MLHSNHIATGQPMSGTDISRHSPMTDQTSAVQASRLSSRRATVLFRSLHILIILFGCLRLLLLLTRSYYSYAPPRKLSSWALNYDIGMQLLELMSRAVHSSASISKIQVRLEPYSTVPSDEENLSGRPEETETRRSAKRGCKYAASMSPGTSATWKHVACFLPRHGEA